VSHEKKFIFMKTAKTAGTSVEIFFEPYCLPPSSGVRRERTEEVVSSAGIVGYRGPDPSKSAFYNHMSANDLRKKLGESCWNEYFKFSVIRNPFDKLVSAFYFFNRDNLTVSKNIQEDFLINSFRHWVVSNKGPLDRHIYTIDGNVCLDYFIRYESLLDDIKYLCEVFEIKFDSAQFGEYKRGFRNELVALARYYDAATIRVVEQLYDLELQHFGYALE